MSQIAVSGAGVRFAATTVLRDVTFTVGAGDRWGVIGRNGSGKTTLFKLIAGDLAPTSGVVTRLPGLRVAMLEQHRDFGDALNVWDAVAGAFGPLRALERSLEQQAQHLADVGEGATQRQLDQYARDLERFDHDGGYTYHALVDAVLQGLGFDAEQSKTRPIGQLSGGERGRVGLARQLVVPADVMLLDEPTNHLDLETTRWLEEYLRESRETIMLISHDRAFLSNVVDHVLHVEDLSAVAYSGGYEAFVTQRAERRLTQVRGFQKQQKKVEAEEDYIRRNIAGQNTKQAKGRRKRLERLPRLTAPSGDDDTMGLRFTVRERGGDQVVVADHAGVSVADRPLIEQFSGVVRRRDVIGFVGPNGAGKSTFLKALVGHHPVSSGEVRVGGGIAVAYYRQDMSQVPLDRTLYEIISDLRPLWERGQIQGHLGRFQFSGDEVLRRADSLSGGERARVALAMMMLSGANLFVLDEPTNHLDVESIEALEDAITAYDGTVILVSHDRELLRGLATRIWELRDRRIRVFDGPFDEWDAIREERERTTAQRAAADEVARREVEREAAKREAKRRNSGDARSKTSARDARRAMEQAERDVNALEEKITELEIKLQDPELYTESNAHARAATLQKELERTQRALEQALQAWETATTAAAELDVAR